MSNKELRKQWRNIGFGLAFGLFMGKFFGKCVVSALDGIAIGTCQGLASGGNKRCQNLCDKNNIAYEKHEEE